MSISSEISRLQTAKADIADAIADKGVTVPSGSTLDDFADLIDAIQTGGGGGITAATGEITLATDVAAPSSNSASVLFPGLDLDFKPDFLWITMTEASFQSLTTVSNHIFGVIAMKKTAMQTMRYGTNSSTASLTKDTVFMAFVSATTTTDSSNGYMENGVSMISLNSVNNEYWKLNDDGTFNFGANGSSRLGWYAGTYRYVAAKFS